jgi:class 3 adenylate cyclase/tetratricopeptide (TPR) repeat protein
MPVCAQCGTDNPDIARFCLACGASLAEAPAPLEVRKTVTIVFSDLKGSTAMGERLDSEAVREVMSRYFDAMRAELERHGGVVEKYIGDAIMAVFGLPTLHEDDAVRAVRAAFGMQQALAELNDELEHQWGVRLANRTGVNTGEVVAGDPSAGQRLVTGDTVNVAARLEQAAGEREVLLGELTYRLVRDAVEVEQVEPLELKGKAERVPAYRLLSVAEMGEGWARRDDLPMVGRVAELELLLSTFEEAVATRSARLVTVVGDAGVGKSRLNDEFLHRIAGRARILRGRCLSYGEGITFWPLVEAVHHAASIREEDAPEAALEKLTALAKDGDVAQRVAAAIGVGEEQFPIDELFWGARKLLETLAHEQPLVVLFDDIHWAERTFLDLIEHLVASVQQAPLLLLCPARHDLLEAQPDWATLPGGQCVILAPLTSAETEMIVGNLLGEAGIGEDARARIVAAADGNPLFVEQLLSMLIDNGSLRCKDGKWVSMSALDDVSVPPTIHALLSARLDRLLADERAVIEPASVIGQVFAEPAVQELVAEHVRAGVPGYLGDLTRKHLVRPDLSALDEDRYRFAHVLIRDAAYNGLLKRARATFHERFVEWADRVNRERGREHEYEEILGYHLEQAHRYLSELGPLDDHGHDLGRDAARRLTSAGHRAFARGDARAAASLLGRAIALLPDDDHSRLELVPDHGEALLQAGRFEEADMVLTGALVTAERESLDALRAKLSLVRLLVQLRAGAPVDWREQVLVETEAAIEIFEGEGDDAGLIKAWRLLTWAHGIACRYGDAAQAAERAFDYACRAGDKRQQSRIATAYPMAAFLGPTPVEEAVARSQEYLERVSGDRSAEATVLSQLACLRALGGSFDEARADLARARAILDDLGLRVEVARVDLDAERVERLAGNFEAAERALVRAHEVLEDVGERYVLPTVEGYLAHTLYALGRHDEVQALVSRQEPVSEDDVETQALWLTVKGKELARQGSVDAGEALIREALSVLESTDASLFRFETLLDLAEAQRLGGNSAAAHTTLEAALQLAEQKGSSVLRDFVQQFLPEPAPSAVPSGHAS